jgi:hypothetical protein
VSFARRIAVWELCSLTLVVCASIVHSEKLTETWCIGLRAVILHTKQPRLLPSVGPTLVSWIREVFQAVDRNNQACVHSRKLRDILAAANSKPAHTRQGSFATARRTSSDESEGSTSPRRTLTSYFSSSRSILSRTPSQLPGAVLQDKENGPNLGIQEVQREILQRLVGESTRSLFARYSAEANGTADKEGEES